MVMRRLVSPLTPRRQERAKTLSCTSRKPNPKLQVHPKPSGARDAFFMSLQPGSASRAIVVFVNNASSLEIPLFCLLPISHP